MQGYCREAYGYLEPYCEAIKQGVSTTIIELNEVRQDPEGLQRICLVALSILEGVNYYTGRTYLPKLVAALDVANSLDFYGFLKIPYHFFHVIDPDKIDEFHTLSCLENVLCVNWGLGIRNENGLLQDPAVHLFAKHCLADLLAQMSVNDLASVDNEKFKATLQEWVVDELTAHPQHGWDAALIDLSQLEVAQKRDSWLETLANLTFMGVDVGCVPLFLDEWNLLDLGGYATSLGKFRALSWVPNQSLDTWVRIGLCAGFLLRFLEASRVLREEEVGETTIKHAQWERVLSAAEFLFNFSILCRASQPIVIFLTFVAKSIGIATIVYRPNVCYFEMNR